MSDGQRAFGTRFGDRTAAPADDAILIPQVHREVHRGVDRKAFTPAARLAAARLAGWSAPAS